MSKNNQASKPAVGTSEPSHTPNHPCATLALKLLKHPRGHSKKEQKASKQASKQGKQAATTWARLDEEAWCPSTPCSVLSHSGSKTRKYRSVLACLNSAHWTSPCATPALREHSLQMLSKSPCFGVCLSQRVRNEDGRSLAPCSTLRWICSTPSGAVCVLVHVPPWCLNLGF